LFKGKGKGKGFGAGPKGKAGTKGLGKAPATPFSGTRDYCKTVGHTKSRCPHLGKGFTGKCFTCGNIGHPARLCPKGQGKGLNSLDDEEQQGQLGGCWQLSYLERAESLQESKDLHDSIDAVEEDKEYDWEYVKMTVDSGSIDTVAPPSLVPDVPIEPTEASKSGKGWRAANGTEIKNLGKKVVHAKTDEAHDIAMEVHIAEELTKFLGSVYRITRAGNSVIFHPPGYDDVIYNWNTGQSTKMTEEKGAYHVGMWVKVPKKKGEKEADDGFTTVPVNKSSFRRQRY